MYMLICLKDRTVIKCIDRENRDFFVCKHNKLVPIYFYVWGVFLYKHSLIISYIYHLFQLTSVRRRSNFCHLKKFDRGWRLEEAGLSLLKIANRMNVVWRRLMLEVDRQTTVKIKYFSSVRSLCDDSCNNYWFTEERMLLTIQSVHCRIKSFGLYHLQFILPLIHLYFLLKVIWLCSDTSRKLLNPFCCITLEPL